MNQTTLYPISLPHAHVLATLHGMCFNPSWDRRAILEILSMSGTLGQLMMVGDIPVGYILWRVILDEAEILTILIIPAYRRKGLADQLIAQSLKNIKIEGVKKMFLEVAESNHAAQTLYIRHGFHQVGVRKGYYNGEDARLLVKDI